MLPSLKSDKKLSPNQEALLEAFYSANGELTPVEAAKVAGVNPNRIYATIKAVRKELVELAEILLIQHAPKAANLFGKVLDSDERIPNVNAKVEAAKTILDRIGLGKKEQLEVQTTVTGNLFFLPAKRAIKEEDIVEGCYEETQV